MVSWCQKHHSEFSYLKLNSIFTCPKASTCEKSPWVVKIWYNEASIDTENVINDFLVPGNVGLDTNIVLLGYSELKLCDKT